VRGLKYSRELDCETPIDRWVSYAVKVLRDNGIETYESCQGGPGHSYAEPAVRFHGTQPAGSRIAAILVGRQW
jgi:hypothetical protein